MTILGADPGASGGLALLSLDGRVLEVVKMPPTPRALVLTISAFVVEYPVIVVTQEHVWTSPQMGVVSAGTFMRNVGRLETAFAVFGLPVSLVTPVKWQRAMGLVRPKTPFGTKDKNINKALAASLFPGLTISHATADALLLAEYGRQLIIMEAHEHGEEERGST